MRVPTQKSFIEQQLPVFPESDNTHDKEAAAVYKDGSVALQLFKLYNLQSVGVLEKIHDQSQLGYMYSAS